MCPPTAQEISLAGTAQGLPCTSVRHLMTLPVDVRISCCGPEDQAVAEFAELLLLCCRVRWLPKNMSGWIHKLCLYSWMLRLQSVWYAVVYGSGLLSLMLLLWLLHVLSSAMRDIIRHVICLFTNSPKSCLRGRDRDSGNPNGKKRKCTHSPCSLSHIAVAMQVFAQECQQGCT